MLPGRTLAMSLYSNGTLSALRLRLAVVFCLTALFILAYYDSASRLITTFVSKLQTPRVPIHAHAFRPGWMLEETKGENLWDTTYYCRDAVVCRATNGPDIPQSAHVVLSVGDSSTFSELGANQTAAFAAMEPSRYMDIDRSFYKYKATSFQNSTAPGSVWITYVEKGILEYFSPDASLKMTSKSTERLVMFMSSRCVPYRDNIIRSLRSEGIDIWSFGTCASEQETTDRVKRIKDECGDRNGRHTANWRSPKACITEKFKFILSLENTIMDDYVSEKFFAPFDVGTVPLYFGAPNAAEFSPGNNSFVDLRRLFGDPLDFKALAAFLKRINTDDYAYEQYFEWKRKHSSLDRFTEVARHGWRNLPCLLCEKFVQDLNLTR